MNLITEITNKIADITGFESSTYNKTSHLTNELVKSSLKGAVNLSDYIFYRYFDQDKQLFFGEHGMGGFCLEISPIVGVNPNAEISLDYFFKKELPDNYFVQFLLLASNEIEPILSLWESGRTSSHPILQKLTKRRAEYIRKRAGDLSGKYGRIARDFKIFINVSRQIALKESDIKELVGFRKILLEKLKNMQFQSRVCDEHDLIALNKEIFEFREGSQQKYECNNPYATLNERVLSANMRYRLDDKCLNNLTTNISTSCFSLNKYPSDWSLGKMINLLGDSQAFGSDLPCRFIISYTVASNITSSHKSTLIAKGTKVIEASEQWYSRHNRDLHRQAINWKDVIDSAKNEDRFLSESFQVAVSSSLEMLASAEQAIVGLYSKYGFELIRQDNFHLPSLLSMLPMMQSVYWGSLSMVRNVKIALSSTVMSRLPIHAEWKGVPESGILFFGRNGQIFNWNHFYKIASGNFNGVVIGPSGGGKSVALQENVVCQMCMGAQVFVLDIGKSFQEIAKLLDGDIIQFGKSVRVVLNPFSTFKPGMNLEDFNLMVKGAKALLTIMCGAEGEVGEAELEKAIKAAVQLNNYQIDINGFVEYLQASDSARLRDYGLSLYSYTSDGIYGKYFSGGRSSDFKKQLTIFEFEEIKKDEKLMSIVLQTLLMEITNQFLLGDRKKRFVIIIDEAWNLLDYTAKFIAELYRTVRKYNGAIISCVQNISDLDHDRDRKTILSNSTWTVLLQQNKTDLGNFRNSEAFKDKLSLIESISFVPGKFSEMLLYTNGVAVVGRLLLDKYSATLYSTDAADYSALETMQKQGMSLDEAIEELSIKKYGEAA